MKSNQFLKEGFVEDANEVKADHEVQMARADLYHAAEDALALHKMLRNISEQQGLEGWVASKITLAADYLKTVREYIEYELISAADQIETAEVDIAEARQSAAVKLQKAFKREQERSEASRKRGEELLKSASKKNTDDNKKPEVAEASDISGLLAASKLNRSYIVTAETAEGQTKKFRVKAQSEQVAKEKFSQHYSQSKILDVKEEGVAEGVEIVNQDSDLDQEVFTLNVDGKKVLFTYWDYETNFQNPDIKDIYQQAKEQLGKKLSPEQIKSVARSVFKSFDQGVAEGAMPASVIKSKQRYAEMTPAEFAKAHADKSDEELKAMAWRHGYGKGSSHYVDKRNKGKQGVAEGAEDYADMYSPEAIQIGKKFCDTYGLTDEDDVQLAVEIIDGYLDYAKESNIPVNLNDMKRQVADAFREVYRGMGKGPSFRKKFSEQDSSKNTVNETSAGSVATVVNPTPQNKAKVGTLFGGTYKQKKSKAK